MIQPHDEDQERSIRFSLDTQVTESGSRLQVMTHVPELLPKKINRIVLEALKLDTRMANIVQEYGERGQAQPDVCRQATVTKKMT